MPAIMLTDALLRSAAPGKKLVELWDARVSGLCLRVSPGGVRTWTFRYRPKDSASFKRLALGRYPEVGLSLARQRAQEKRVEVAGGADPQGERKAKREAQRGAMSFDALANDYLERFARLHKRSWVNDQIYLRAHVRPVWGPRPANRISRADAATLLDTIAKTARPPRTARKASFRGFSIGRSNPDCLKSIPSPECPSGPRKRRRIAFSRPMKSESYGQPSTATGRSRRCVF
jgi:Arm DNA-binding domain